MRGSLGGAGEPSAPGLAHVEVHVLSSLSPILSFVDRVLLGIEVRVVAPLAARFYQLVPHCSGCGGPVPHDPLDCEGCRTLDAFELRGAALSWTWTSHRQATNRARRPATARVVQYLPMSSLAPEDAEEDTLQSA